MMLIGLWALALRQGDLPPGASPCSNGPWASLRDADLRVWFPRMAAPLGAAYALAGRTAEALPLLEQAVDRRWQCERCRLPGALSSALGEAHLVAGHLEEAQTPAQRALSMPVRTRNRATKRTPCASSARSRRAASLRRSNPAETHYRQALALAEALGMRPLQAHCHLGLGTLYTRTGQQEQARAALSTAIGLYRAMDMHFWLPQAEAALAQTGGAGPV